VFEELITAITTIRSSGSSTQGELAVLSSWVRRQIVLKARKVLVQWDRAHGLQMVRSNIRPISPFSLFEAWWSDWHALTPGEVSVRGRTGRAGFGKCSMNACRLPLPRCSRRPSLGFGQAENATNRPAKELVARVSSWLQPAVDDRGEGSFLVPSPPCSSTSTPRTGGGRRCGEPRSLKELHLLHWRRRPQDHLTIRRHHSENPEPSSTWMNSRLSGADGRSREGFVG